MRLAGAVCLLGIPALLVYLQLVGFSPEWRAKVARAIGGSTFAVEIGKLTFHPFEGIVAEGVTLKRRGESSVRLARIDRLVVSPNLAALLRGRVSIDRLGLESAEADIPFSDDGREPSTLELRDIRAEILNGNGLLTISRAECLFEGIHLVLHGHLLNPETVSIRHTPPTPEHVEQRTAAIRAALAAVRRARFTGARPELDVAVRGDLSQPESIAADSITLRAGGVKYDALSFDRVNLAASFVDRALRLAHLRAAGRSGSVQIAGEWNVLTSSGRFDVNGRLRSAPLLVLAGRSDLAEQIFFDQPPALDATITLSPGPRGLSVSALGQVSTKGFRLKGVRGRGFSAAFAWKNQQLYVQDAVLHSSTGVVQASVMMSPGRLRIGLDSAADPREFREFFGPKERAIIDLLDFKDPPKLHITLDGTRPSLDAMSGSGTLELGRSAMRGSWIDFAKSQVVIQDRAILYKDLVIGKGAQRATGSFTYDFGRHEVRLDGIRSNLDPPAVLMWVDPRIAATVAVYRFRTPPDVRADGLAHMEDPNRNDLHVAVNAPGGLAYTLLNRDLVFGATQGTVWIKGQKVLVDVPKSSLYRGGVALKTQVSTNPADPTFGVDVSVDHVDFPSLTRLYFGYSKSQGAMSGHYAFTASLREPSKMRGSGSVRVEEGHVLAIPLFGPLSDVISAIIPGAGHESARLATADFTIGDQWIRTKNLEIQGAGFELFGDGGVQFPSGRLDLTVRINAKGIPGLVLLPVSKLLEYVSTGFVSDPQWRPKIVPREFWQILGLGGGNAPQNAPQTAPAPTKTPEPKMPPAPGKSANGGKTR
jgi:hypothetical protein